LQSGEPVANFSLATSEKWTSKSGEKQERTEWHRIEVWGKTAEVVQSYVSKGSQVYVEGSMHYEEWNDKDGNKRNTPKVKVSFGGKLILLGSKNEEKQSAKPQSEAQAPVVSSDDDIPF
jgi:single-strand DNA-binding protein